MLRQIETPEIGRHSYRLDTDMTVALGTSLTNPYDAKIRFATIATNLNHVTFAQFEVLQPTESAATNGDVDGVRQFIKNFAICRLSAYPDGKDHFFPVPFTSVHIAFTTGLLNSN
jgi:hypothetical protein